MAKQLDKKFIGNDQVDGDKLKLLVGQTIRKEDGVGGSIDVLAAIDASIAVVEASIVQEISDRISGDASTLSGANAYTDFGISAEAALRISGDAASVASSNAYSDSGDASTLLMANSYTDSGISAEEALRISGDASTLSSANVYSDSGDASTLLMANSYTDMQVSAEAALRVSGDAASVASANAYSDSGDASTLLMANSYTDSQIVLAQGDISAAEAAIAQEIIDRAAADAALQVQIDNVLSNVDGTALDSLTEIVSAFQAADSSLNGAITALSTGLSADIAAETAARISADAALQGEIDAEEGARAAADVTLQSNINAEAATRLAADNALDARVDVLESVVWFKEKFSISNGQTFVTLAHSPEVKSMTAFVDRLGIHEGAAEDFTISGSTMTFLNDLVSPGQSQIGSGDSVYVKYQYKV